MSDNNDIVLDFGQGAGYEPYAGDGTAVLLPFDGVVKAKITKITSGKSSSGNDTVKIVMAVTEEGLGGTLYADIPVSGSRKDNGEPNFHRFLDVLSSAGWSMQRINQIVGNKEKIKLSSITQQLLAESPTVCVDTRADDYKGRVTSKVGNFVTPAQYEKMKPARRPRSGAMTTGGATRSAPAAGNEDLLSALS